MLDKYIDALETDLSLPRGFTQFFVGTEGYAWNPTSFDLRRGGNNTVSMQRGAILSVYVRGVDETAHAFLRLHSDKESTLITEVQLTRDGMLEFSGLAPSVLRVTAEIGDWWDAPIVLGETSIALRAQVHLDVALDLEPAPVFATSTAGGVIHLAREWNPERERKVMVVMNLLDTPIAGFDSHQMTFADRIASIRSGFDSFRWATEPIQAGKYEAQRYYLPFSIVLDLPEGENVECEWTLPPPVELLVYAVDDATNEDVVIDDLKWAPHRPEGLDRWHSMEATYDHDRRCYVIRSPEVEIDLATWSWDYQLFHGSVDLRAGIREHTIRLDRAFGIVVELTNHGSPVAFPEGWFGRLMPAVSGEGHCVLADRGDFERRFTVSEPGAYLLEIPKVSGYLPVPIQTIEILPGEFARHVVELDSE